MIYTFARIGVVLQMNVGDYFSQGRRGWVRLHEKGGKEHEVPCHHMLEKYLDEYLAAAEIAADTEGPLFRTTGRKTGQAHAMWQQDAYRMIQRRAAHAGIKTRIGNPSIRHIDPKTSVKLQSEASCPESKAAMTTMVVDQSENSSPVKSPLKMWRLSD